MLVETWNLRKLLTTGLHKCLAPANPDFLDCLKAIRYKSRANNQQLLDPFFSQSFQFKVGVRLQPRILAQPRLKRDRVFLARHTGVLNKGCGCLKTLCAITCRVRRTGDFTTVPRSQAMRPRWIRLLEMPLRQAMVAE